MQIKNKTMYHLHRTNKYDKLWIVGNTIKVDCNFEGYATRAINQFNTHASLDTKTLDEVIKEYLTNKNLDQRELVRLLIDARSIIYDTNIFKREEALEEVRRKMYPYLPSRKNSLFVTDKKGLDFWKKSLVHTKHQNNLALFEVLLTGNLFKSSSYLLPHPETTYEEAKKQAENYWNPNFNNIKDDQNEYLFQGGITITKQIKLSK